MKRRLNPVVGVEAEAAITPVPGPSPGRLGVVQPGNREPRPLRSHVACQGGLHSTIVRCWGPMSHSTLIWSRTCPPHRESLSAMLLAMTGSAARAAKPYMCSVGCGCADRPCREVAKPADYPRSHTVPLGAKLGGWRLRSAGCSGPGLRRGLSGGASATAIRRNMADLFLGGESISCLNVATAHPVLEGASQNGGCWGGSSLVSITGRQTSRTWKTRPRLCTG